MRNSVNFVAIFDVEGTLIDCVSETLQSWRQTLAEFGHSFDLADLQPYSGMDGSQMLECLLPEVSNDLRKRLLKEQGKNYRRFYISRVGPFMEVRELFESLKRADVGIGIATTCQEDELETYDSMMHALELVDAVTCGGEVKRGKPDPALFRTTLIKLGAPDPSEAVAIGDTPYDAKAAISLGINCMGLLTGGFSLSDLEQAGCSCVIASLTDVPMRLESMRSRVNS
jgi:phosphoglycolate phosphatase-like HAD superfamily hydrolase